MCIYIYIYNVLACVITMHEHVRNQGPPEVGSHHPRAVREVAHQHENAGDSFRRRLPDGNPRGLPPD